MLNLSCDDSGELCSECGVANESCALNAALPIGFSAVIIWAGVVVPLPLLPPLPLPRPGHLGNVVARMLRPIEGTLRYTDVGSTVG